MVKGYIAVFSAYSVLIPSCLFLSARFLLSIGKIHPRLCLCKEHSLWNMGASEVFTGRIPSPDRLRDQQMVMDCCWGWVLSSCFTPPTSSLHGIIISHQKCFSTFSPLLQGLGAVSLSLVEELPCFLITCPQHGASEVESLYFFIFILSALVAQSICAAMFYWLCLLFKFVFYRCGGTVGAIFTCPLEVIKTRLQSSKLAFRAVYYPQVQLGTISGEGMVRPTSVSPGLFSVLKWVLTCGPLMLINIRDLSFNSSVQTGNADFASDLHWKDADQLGFCIQQSKDKLFF